MTLFRLFVLFCLSLLWTGCANVRVAVYDKEKRETYTAEAKEAYRHSPAGKANAWKKSVMESARDYIGAPYRYGGTDAKKGFDCSGLVYTAARENQLDLPRSSSLMAKAAPHIPVRKAIPGDLVFFGDRGKVHHVGIIEKNTADELVIIHSTNQLGVIRENVYESAYWKKRILYAVDLTAFRKGKATGKS